MDDLLQDFLTETGENIALLDSELVKLEQNPNDPALISSIFRLVHTIKGTCGFLGLPRLEHVAHAAENVLGKFRDRELTVTPPAVTLILAALDTIKLILGSLETTGAEPAGDDTGLIERLNDAAEGKFAEAGAAKGKKKAKAEPVDALSEAFGEPVRAESYSAPAVEPEPARAAVPTPQPAPVPKIAHPVAEASAPAAHEPSSSQSIRVNVDLLENLMTTVSELVLTRNQLLQILRSEKESQFSVPLQRLNQVVSELQEGVMKTRMQPIGNAWAKLPRLIRDLSQDLSKKIELDMRGSETELDRQVLELIKDPLTHMVRNSADHGIENPADRLAAGKSESGRILLNAFHQGGYILIQIGDDGRGLNIDRIRDKAIANGLATEAELAVMSEAQIQQFIFRAGFSTAEAVTSVSGRGVGMDVVKTNIEKIGGTIELRSVMGQGSTFTIKIPLTLAIVSALIVEVSSERYAIPQLSVIELVRASTGPHAEHRIEHIDDARVLRLRDQLLPLITLQALLKLEPAPPAKSDEQFIVVTQVDGQVFGIVVDRVFDTEEIVVKPVSPVVRNVAMFSGNTILGDGSVIMILDPKGIATAAGDVSLPVLEAMSQTKQVHAERTTRLLVFRAGNSGPKAVPLALISRLEEFRTSDIETLVDRAVIQYRGKLMPVIPFDDNAANLSGPTQKVLVFSDDRHTMGLMVDEILDITDAVVTKELESGRPGVIGSAIVSGRATELMDSSYFLQQAFPSWFNTTDADIASAKHPKRILAVDDSPFFRNLLTPLLGVAGYEVISVSSAIEALTLCENGESFDAIISDIEMPGMTGYEFAEALREKPRWAATPILALSSRTTSSDIAHGLECGFTDYIAKSDRNGILDALHRQFNHVGGHA